MSIITVIFIAFGLAMDAFAVSIASGFGIKYYKIRQALRMAFFFGFFQAAMPIVGWAAGFKAREFVSGIDHWIAFGLLCAIGIKMIYESFKIKKFEKEPDCISLYTLLILSVATSIDALAVGISLSFINVPIIMPAVIIGIITFIMSFLGVGIGKKFGHFFESKIEVIGGIILIVIGIKILIEHLN